jgi:hypothetical protein
MIDHKLRDDMMHFAGMLDALHWAAVHNLLFPSDTMEAIEDRYNSILKRLFKDFDND